MANPTPAWALLDRAFEGAVRRALELGRPPVVLFSGGIDSGLLAWELRDTPGSVLFTAGRDGSADLLQAARAAPMLGLPWSSQVLDDERLAALDSTVRPELEDVPGPRRGIFLALAGAIQAAPSGPLLCGQGADELFFGYAHYRGLSVASAETRSREDLRRLIDEDWPRTLRIAARWARKIHAPYLDPEFLAAAMEVPAVERLPGELTKEYFRRWAAHRGLPGPLAEAPKRALQYGSGVDRWLRRRRGERP